MFDFLNFDFMQNALAAALLVSVACGIVGTLVVVNRMSFLAGGVAHAAYGGLGIAAFAGWPPILGTIGFTLLASVIMGFVSRKIRERADAVIGVMWAVGMAVGIVLIDLTPGYYADLMSYLFGSILAVSRQSLLFMLLLNIVIAGTVRILYKEILGMSYDEEFATISGLPVRVLYYVNLLLIAFTIVMLIRIVGLILVIALFTIPASISEMISRNLWKMMLTSIALCMIFTILGLLLSYALDLTSGATIILVAGVCYGVALVVRSIAARRNFSKAGIGGNSQETVT